jgi:hypothetical protein
MERKMYHWIQVPVEEANMLKEKESGKTEWLPLHG